MNKMADTVVKRNNQQEKELERKVVQYQIEKEERDRRMEELKKEEMRRRN